jgi:hypothetical protein
MFNPEAFVKYKDLPNLTSMFGNLGNSWNNALPNDLYIRGVPKNILSSSTLTNNNGTGLDPLRTFTFPAKSLKSNGDLFHAWLAGVVASNDDNKRLQLSFGGTVLFNSGLFDFDGGGWQLELLLIRVDATHVNSLILSATGFFAIDSTLALASAGVQYNLGNANSLTVNNMDTNSNDLLLECESATASTNIFHNVAKIELTRF